MEKAGPGSPQTPRCPLPKPLSCRGGLPSRGHCWMQLQRSETHSDAGREHKEGLLQSVGGTALQREVPELSVVPVLSAVPTWVHPTGGDCEAEVAFMEVGHLVRLPRGGCVWGLCVGCLDEIQGALTEGGLAWVCGSSRCLWSLVPSVLRLTWEGRASPEEQHR